MKNVLILLLLLISFFAIHACSKNEPVSSHKKVYNQKYDPERNPAEDLKLAIADAQSENKKILLKVGGEWCSWCHLLENFIESSGDILKLYDDTFITMKVNVSKENKNKEFLGSYPEANGYPFLIILDKSGKLLGTEDTGGFEEGKGYSAEKIKSFILKYHS